MIENLKFGQAIEALKEGKRVSRKGWNGKNMHIFLEEHFTALINMGGRKLEREYEPVICMWTAQQTTQPGWLASQADILADDWCILDQDNLFYLWKDKASTKAKVLTYITDFKDIREDGKVNIPSNGYMDVELIFSSPKKSECIDAAKKLVE